MASFEAICAQCGKNFRMVGAGQTLQELQESVPLHKPGTEGDDDCAAKYHAAKDVNLDATDAEEGQPEATQERRRRG